MVFFAFMDVILLLPVLFFFILLVINETGDGEDGDPYSKKRFEMVESQIVSRGVQDRRVIEAMLKVPRHVFVPEGLRGSSYNDCPIPIEMGQTVSQPYIVALMTELLNPSPNKKILEVGTGSGYQSAVLAETGCDLYTIEIIEPIARKARQILEGLGYTDIKFRVGDGYRGWDRDAPFDGIIVTAAPGRIPEKLIEQLKPQGRMVIPVGDVNQELLLVEKTGSGTNVKKVTSVRFVPMTGQSEKT